MLPTEVLMNEHRVIEQVLEVLHRIAAQAEADGRIDGVSARGALEFFRNFADACHHGKEEAQLFPALEQKGLSRDSGPTGVMRHEHEMGRELNRKMAAAVDADHVGDFAHAADLYVQLLTDHIQKEDHCLFSMANQVLSAEDQAVLMTAFERVESEEMGEGTHERFHQLADDLADRYGVPRAAVKAGADGRAFTCSHHGAHQHT